MTRAEKYLQLSNYFTTGVGFFFSKSQMLRNMKKKEPPTRSQTRQSWLQCMDMHDLDHGARFYFPTLVEHPCPICMASLAIFRSITTRLVQFLHGAFISWFSPTIPSTSNIVETPFLVATMKKEFNRGVRVITLYDYNSYIALIYIYVNLRLSLSRFKHYVIIIFTMFI